MAPSILFLGFLGVFEHSATIATFTKLQNVKWLILKVLKKVEVEKAERKRIKHLKKMERKKNKIRS